MPKNATTKRARILIVDDHPSVREALASRIGRQTDMEVCGEAPDIPEALRLVSETSPNVAVVDISLKDGNGLDLIKQINYSHPSVHVLVWSMHSESLYAERVLRAGALGYVNKDRATEVIVDAIRRVIAGKVYLSDEMSEKILKRRVGTSASDSAESMVETLADRELEVFTLIGKGMKTADIARQLDLSVKTIETYRDRIRHKLNLADGVALAKYAIQWAMENE
jgi:DNA-binding NarL/FixJ family response regulator